MRPGGVAVNILPCQGRDHGFKSRPGRHRNTNLDNPSYLRGMALRRQPSAPPPTGLDPGWSSIPPRLPPAGQPTLRPEQSAGATARRFCHPGPSPPYPPEVQRPQAQHWHEQSQFGGKCHPIGCCQSVEVAQLSPGAIYPGNGQYPHDEQGSAEKRGSTCPRSRLRSSADAPETSTGNARAK
jgi:hypothetical protein